MKKLVLMLVLACNCLYSQAQSQNKDQSWTGIMQGIELPSFAVDRKFKLSASVLVKSDDKNASAGIYANTYGPKSILDQEYKLIKGGDSVEWKTYVVEGTIKKDTRGILIGGWAEYNGQFLFDDFELSIDNGKNFEKIPLVNADFEKISGKKDQITGWLEGLEKDKVIHANGFALAIIPDATRKSKVMSMVGKGLKYDSSAYLIPAKGYTPQMGALVSMLNNLSARVEKVFGPMTQQDVDYLMDDKANSIGALIMHLAAAEVYYQIATFEGRMKFNEEEEAKWGVAFRLGDEARDKFKGKDVSYYLNEFRTVRKKTLEELAKRDDEWLLKDLADWGANNYWGWFHVMEHQSSHLGQGLLIQKRIPKKEMNTTLQKLEN